MQNQSTDEDSERVLLLPSAPRDGGIAREVLAEVGIRGEVCASVAALREEIERGAGAALLAEERLGGDELAMLRATLAKQPPWSDFPLLIIGTRAGARASWTGTSSPSSISGLGNVTLLDAPVRMRTLAQAARAAIRSRRRQYMARHAIEQRDRFLAMLGHELRNPLSVISLAVQLGISEPSKSAAQLPILQRQVKHLGALLDDLLDVARITAGKLVLKQERIAVDDMLRRVARGSRPRFAEARLELREVRGLEGRGPVEVVGDVVRLEQVLNNLLTNALKYTLPGGEVFIGLAIVEGFVEICVTDSGVGISPEMLPRVFELFTQAETSLARSDGGMGVGLALVRTLVELHGGEVRAQSEGIGN